MTREQALRSLTTGRSVSGLVGRQDREPLIAIATRPGPLTIYVALPPAGPSPQRHPLSGRDRGRRLPRESSTRRRPGCRGSSRSPTWRRPRSTSSRARSRCSASGRGTSPRCAQLDLRLTRAHDSRAAATAGLAALLACLTAAAFATRSRRLARAALLAAPGAISIALLLSAAGIRSPLAVGVAVAAGGAAAGPRGRAAGSALRPCRRALPRGASSSSSRRSRRRTRLPRSGRTPTAVSASSVSPTRWRPSCLRRCWPRLRPRGAGS